MEGYMNPLGFTKQTATLLRGLGASELIPECKKRNISTTVLHALNDQDFIQLGADTEKVKEIMSNLNGKKRRNDSRRTDVQDRIRNFLEILKNGEKQLRLIQAFLAYSRVRLSKERINSFVDANSCDSASDILPVSFNATLVEIEETKKHIDEFEALVIKVKKKQKPRYHQLCVIVGGLGLAIFIVLKTCSN